MHNGIDAELLGPHEASRLQERVMGFSSSEQLASSSIACTLVFSKMRAPCCLAAAVTA